MTRREFLNRKVEEKISAIVKKINKRKRLIPSKVAKMNTIGFLYSCGRVSPLHYLMVAARELTPKEFKEFEKTLEEEDNER